MLLEKNQDAQTSVVVDSPSLPSMQDIFTASLIQCQNDVESASSLALRTLKKELPDVYRAKLDAAMLFWIKEELRSSRTDLRDYIAALGTGEPPPARQPLGVKSLKAFSRSWFNWPVLSGVFLGSATRVDLQQAAANYMREVDQNTRRAKLLMAIAEKMPNDKVTVAKAFKESAIAQLAVKFGVSAE